MSDFEKMKAKVKQFTIDRDWDQFHNGKDLAIALSGEASELLNAFLWKKPEDVKDPRPHFRRSVHILLQEAVRIVLPEY